MADVAVQWKTRPHIRLGDPCYRCGIPLTPASRWYCKITIPAGYRKHAGLGLCGPCAKAYRRGDWS